MIEGVIVQVLKSGLAYVEDLQSRKRYVFRFGKIRDYRGETARELKLRVGSPVRFRRNGELVEEVELIEVGSRRGSRHLDLMQTATESEAKSKEKAAGANTGA